MSLEQRAAKLSPEEIFSLLAKVESLEKKTSELEDQKSELEHQKSQLKHELDWYKRQLFGQKSERRLAEADGRQLRLGEFLQVKDTPPPPKQTIKSYERSNRKKRFDDSVEDTGLRFDPSVPVEEIVIDNPELEGLSEDDYEVIGEKTTHRLAQRPGSYVVLKYVRKVIKLKDNQEISCPAAPGAVFEKSYADVSFIVGLLIDKFLYHLPLYRQHQRLQASGIKLSRTTLTNLVHRSAELLEPIFYALLSSIVQSDVLLMDETHVRAGRRTKGKMNKGYFWPVMGDQGEIAFLFSASRAQKIVREALEDFCGVLVTDGYKVYEQYAQSVNTVVHAQCWVHARRYFIKAEKMEPRLVNIALDYIRQLYAVEDEIIEKELTNEKKVIYRIQHSRPIVDQYFTWLRKTHEEHVLLPSNPFTTAVNYSLKREQALRIFLRDPDVPLDTNKLEGALRPIPMGRKNWLFCWTEVGARYAGIIQSLLQSCKMQGVDPYTYLVDVLQRVETHPMIDVHLLTPRLWKDNFADKPIRSDLDLHCQ